MLKSSFNWKDKKPRCALAVWHRSKAGKASPVGLFCFCGNFVGIYVSVSELLFDWQGWAELCISCLQQRNPRESESIALMFSERCWYCQMTRFGEQAESSACPLSFSSSLKAAPLCSPAGTGCEVNVGQIWADSPAVCSCAYSGYSLPAPTSCSRPRSESGWCLETRPFCGENECAGASLCWQNAGSSPGLGIIINCQCLNSREKKHGMNIKIFNSLLLQTGLTRCGCWSLKSTGWAAWSIQL